MNGIHDMGGLTCFGPVRREPDEPVFHSDWERRVFAMNLAGMAFLGPVDRARHAIERMDPAEYLTTPYYEHWLAAIVTMAKDLGYLTDEELRTGRAAGGKTPPHPPPTADMIEALVRSGMPATRTDGRNEPRFRVGDRVRARNLDIPGHTRLARYVRGKVGVVTMHHGSHVFPDTVAHDRGENAQPLYNVRFEAKELWGDNVARRDCVHIDLWEDYLEPAGETRSAP
ncbi:MAG TPA: nitrile hydratase subunit beta [Gammaproteobacteria bacterium]